MARSAQQRMFALMRQWQGSGMNQKDFCMSRPRKTLHYL
jgi:hypothetical protein